MHSGIHNGGCDDTDDTMSILCPALGGELCILACW